MRVTLSLTVRDANGAVSTRSWGKINPKYTVMMGYMGGSELPVVPVTPATLPNGFETFAAWADSLMRYLNSLSTNTYGNSKIQAVWDVNEEVAD